MSAIPGFFTVAEAANIIGRDHSTVSRYVRNKKIDHRRVGREILIPEHAVRTFIPPEPGNPLFKQQKRSQAS